MSDLYDLPLVPPAAGRARKPVHVDGQGHVVHNPRELLGLPEGVPLTEQAIRSAWHEALLAHPPEREPEMARWIREARDHLLTAEGELALAIGRLQVPDESAWGLDGGADEAELQPMLNRLLAQSVIYALIEEVCWDDGMAEAMKAAAAEVEKHHGVPA